MNFKVETISYSQFKHYIAEGNIGKLNIGPENINGTLKAEPVRKFTTIRVNDPDLVKDLDGHKVNYSGHYENKFLSDGTFWMIWPISFLKRKACREMSSELCCPSPPPPKWRIDRLGEYKIWKK